ncbi:hypothetical protein EMPG_17061 [Blastomyces silverae]|uniref:Uncharacterized protein n=1 Tax=Blastomyces silverae TaxID=2060906 RepID=A0A0H1B8P5_9EURO|nr:hypothetical protein EMPG_17061 [Blastomyces silverae]
MDFRFKLELGKDLYKVTLRMFLTVLQKLFLSFHEDANLKPSFYPLESTGFSPSGLGTGVALPQILASAAGFQGYSRRG